MTDSLRDQLLNLGFKPPAPPVKPSRPVDAVRGGRAGANVPRDGRPGSDSPNTHRNTGAPNSNSAPRGNAPPRGQVRKPGGSGHVSHPVQAHGASAARTPAKQRPSQEMDLARAYAIRAQREQQERIDAEASRQEEARRRREARAALSEFLKDKALNVADAEIARHFPYGGKIKRIYVTAEQLAALNSGQLGVMQLDGRYVLLALDVLTEAEKIYPQALALKIDPDAPTADDPYADPLYQVPDDLVW